MRYIFRCLILTVTLALPSQAFAIFEAHGLIGKRWYDVDGDGLQAIDVNAAAYFTLPVPLLTLGIGPSLHYIMLNKDDFNALDSVDSADITILGLEVLAGVALPLTDLEVFAKLRYNLWSQYKLSGDAEDEEGGPDIGVESEAKVTGTNIGIGLRYSLLPFVGLLAQVDFGQEKLTDGDVKIEGVDLEDPDDSNFKSKAFLIGVNIGI